MFGHDFFLAIMNINIEDFENHISPYPKSLPDISILSKIVDIFVFLSNQIHVLSGIDHGFDLKKRTNL